MQKLLSSFYRFAWLGDALEHNSQLASVMNRDGYLAHPATGVTSAMNEYFLIQKNSPPGTKVQPHNMHGRYSWPLISFLWIVLPPKFVDCEKLVVLQSFISLVLFQTSNMDLLIEALGWEPAKSLTSYGSTLGKVVATQDGRDLLFSLKCGSNETSDFYSVGTSSQLATFLLKVLAPYSGEINSDIRLLATDSGIETYLDGMMDKSTDIDMSFTWQPILESYPQLLLVPVFMGSVVPVINLPGLSITLGWSALIAIFSGVITSWDDEAIKVLNPGTELPNQNISVYAAAVSGVSDGPTAAFDRWLSARDTTFTWSQVKATFVMEDEVHLYVNYVPYSIGYGFGHHVVNATRNVPRLIGPAGQSVGFSSEALSACWLGFDYPKCWPMAIPLVMVLQQPVDCARQKNNVDFVFWMSQRAGGLDQFIVPNLNPDKAIGEAEYCKGRSLLRTYPEPQALTSSVEVLRALAGIGMVVAIMQAISLAVARERSELKSASVVFSLLAVVGAFVILIVPFLILQDELNAAACGSSVWLLCLGYSLCFGAIFAKLFRLYTIFTSHKLVVPRLSNKKLLLIVFVFLVIDVILLLIYSILNSPEPYAFSALVPSKEDLVTGNKLLTLEMCSFHVDSPVLYIIFIYKLLVALGGAVMAFFIRQVDRRFSSTSALGWAYWNMLVTTAIAIIVTVQFNKNEQLERRMSIPLYAGVWIMYVTLCALTLDSNVLLACKDFSQPLRKFLSGSGRISKDSKDKSSPTTPNADENEIDPDSSTNKQSRSSMVFVVNREMFPSKYDDFDSDLLGKILQELNFQRTAVRRALGNGSIGTQTTAIELSDVGDRKRGSTRVDSPGTRFASKSRAGPMPPSQETSGTSSFTESPKMASGRLKDVLTESLGVGCSIGMSETTKSDSQIAD